MASDLTKSMIENVVRDNPQNNENEEGRSIVNVPVKSIKSNNRQCIYEEMIDGKDFIMNRRGFSMTEFHAQSLRTHSEDVSTILTKSINTLVLSRTNSKNTEQINILNFHCVSRQKHINFRYGGVAVLQCNDNSLRV
ncbi:hypothetical protein PV327_004093 [Microctonus hyperodae]|uniref:Uncharacterized protein n=1 Tax=Microctonus hyperodae TaxID=165561 RepID=A0AA39KM63_MICHY|nr:hypothetical protein PV327_004093 [Microctonus hyperodae]